MPRKTLEARREYDQQRRQKYREDPEFRASVRAKKREYYKNAPPDMRARWGKDNSERRYRNEFGISMTERDALLAAQGGNCLVCIRPVTFVSAVGNAAHTRAVVDHCHDTGKIRGILCSRCNVFIGQAQDSPEALRAAASYIEAHRGT